MSTWMYIVIFLIIWCVAMYIWMHTRISRIEDHLEKTDFSFYRANKWEGPCKEILEDLYKKPVKLNPARGCGEKPVNHPKSR